MQPEELGWYWYRQDDQHQWDVREVYQEDGRVYTSGLHDDENLIENYPGEWHRITPPEENEFDSLMGLFHEVDNMLFTAQKSKSSLVAPLERWRSELMTTIGVLIRS